MIFMAGITKFILLLFFSCHLFKPKDITPPIVRIILPKDSSYFSGELKTEVEATDSIGVEYVLMFVNGLLIGKDTTEPYEFEWRPKEELPFSWHTLYAKAYDKAKNEGVSETVRVFYVGKEKISIYHGKTTLLENNYLAIKFWAKNRDSLYGETIVNFGERLSFFYLLDEANFNKFKKGETFTPIIEKSNFQEFQIVLEFDKEGSYYLVWLNNAQSPKSIWLRFYLSPD